jgi:hypothetical protein
LIVVCVIWKYLRHKGFFFYSIAFIRNQLLSLSMILSVILFLFSFFKPTSDYLFIKPIHASTLLNKIFFYFFSVILFFYSIYLFIFRIAEFEFERTRILIILSLRIILFILCILLFRQLSNFIRLGSAGPDIKALFSMSFFYLISNVFDFVICIITEFLDIHLHIFQSISILFK